MIVRANYETIDGFDSPWRLRKEVESSLWVLDNAKGIRKETFDRFPDYRRRALYMLKSQSDRILDLKEDISSAKGKDAWPEEIAQLEEELRWARDASRHLQETMGMIPEPHEL